MLLRSQTFGFAISLSLLYLRLRPGAIKSLAINHPSVRFIYDSEVRGSRTRVMHVLDLEQTIAPILKCFLVCSTEWHAAIRYSAATQKLKKKSNTCHFQSSGINRSVEGYMSVESQCIHKTTSLPPFDVLTLGTEINGTRNSRFKTHRTHTLTMGLLTALMCCVWCAEMCSTHRFSGLSICVFD